jgi:very-short-patch-repair endonuclease
MGVSFISENDEFPPYRLDLYLPDYHAAIEVDGPSHSRKKDGVRDTWMLERYFVPTLRIKARGPWQSQEKLNKQIIEFLMIHSLDTEERKINWRTAYIRG